MGFNDAPSVKKPTEDEIENPERRWFLKGLGATTAIAAFGRLMPSPAQATEENISAVIEKFRRETRALFTDPQFLARIEHAVTLEDPAIVDVFKRLALVTEEMIEESSFRLPQGLHAGSRVLESDRGYGNSTVVRFRDSEGTIRHAEVTAAHVVVGVHGEFSDVAYSEGWRTLYPNGPDIAVRELDNKYVQPGEALHLAAGQASHDISGDIGTMLAVDRDLVSEKEFSAPQKKRFLSLVSPRIAHKVYELRYEGVERTKETEWLIDQANDQRFMLIPPTEVTGTGFDSVPARGCSGTAIVYVPHGARGVHLGGVLTAVGPIPVSGVTYFVALIHDHQTVREMIEKNLGVSLLRTQ